MDIPIQLLFSLIGWIWKCRQGIQKLCLCWFKNGHWQKHTSEGGFVKPQFGHPSNLLKFDGSDWPTMIKKDLTVNGVMPFCWMANHGQVEDALKRTFKVVSSFSQCTTSHLYVKGIESTQYPWIHRSTSATKRNYFFSIYSKKNLSSICNNLEPNM